MGDNRASSHMFAWNRWLLGWLNPKQLRGLTAPGTTEATLTPLELPGGLKAVVVPVSSTVFYVIEDRQRIGEDSELSQSVRNSIVACSSSEHALTPSRHTGGRPAAVLAGSTPS